ncbi:MAG: omptin family outer membrane protease [Spirochaetaceae bacterium]|jgi:outer membrane protease|nr:omptin family outer membrane protease [Spirochaetaceae bacterium]
MRMFFGVLFVMILTGVLPAEEITNKNGLSLSINGALGLLYGQSEEIVYRDKRTSDKASQLLWDLKPLVYAGGEANVRWQGPGNTWGIFTDALFKAGLPGNTGIMEDRDWVVLNYPQWLTHYSVHDNKTEQAYLIDARVGASFRIFGPFVLKPYITYNFMFFSWAAKGGSILYPSSDGDHRYYSTPIKVISYEQTWHILSPALALYGAFNRSFDIEISAAVSPFIWSSSVDNHIMRNLVITDEISGGLFLEGGLRFSFTPVDFFALSLSASYRNISGSRGDSIYKEPGQRLEHPNGSGSAYSVFDTGIMARFRIF